MWAWFSGRASNQPGGLQKSSMVDFSKRWCPLPIPLPSSPPNTLLPTLLFGTPWLTSRRCVAPLPIPLPTCPLGFLALSPSETVVRVQLDPCCCFQPMCLPCPPCFLARSSRCLCRHCRWAQLDDPWLGWLLGELVDFTGELAVRGWVA
jgi:hypothetical protein